MTDIHSSSPDSIGAGAPAEEIEVTPEMIAAGVDCYFGLPPELHEPTVGPDGCEEVVRRIFRAMFSALRASIAIRPSSPNFGVFTTMRHQFEISDGPSDKDTLVLVYPPEAIRSLNAILDRVEKSCGGKLPPLMHTPIKGSFAAACADSLVN